MKETKQIAHVGLWTEFCLSATSAGDVETRKCAVQGDEALALQQWSRKAPGVLYQPKLKKCLQVSKKTKNLKLKKCSKSKDTQRFHFEVL